MAKRKKRSDDFEDLQAKGIGCLVVGLVLLFLPVLGGALHPLGWILILLGVALIALTAIIASARKQQGGTNLSAEPRQVGQSQLPINKTRRSPETFGRIGTDFGLRPLSARVEPSFTNSDALPVRATTWSLDVFKAIEWRRFEAVCEALFAQAGFRTESQSHGADGGVDIWLYSKHATGPAAIVQCKHWKNQAVGVKELREFFGVMASHKLARGTYAITSTFTQDAQTFAKANGINTMDGQRLLKQIETRTPEQQKQLLDVAFEGEYWRPTCASCGIKLVERTMRLRPFWGCLNFPRCKTQIWQNTR